MGPRIFFHLKKLQEEAEIAEAAEALKQNKSNPVSVTVLVLNI